MAQANWTATHTAHRVARRLRQKATATADAAQAAHNTRRFVRIAGAVKALRARALGNLATAGDGRTDEGQGIAALLLAAGSHWTTRIAKNATDRLMGRGEVEEIEEDGDEGGDKRRTGKVEEDSDATTAKTAVNAAATRAAARTATRIGAASRAKHSKAVAKHQ